MKITSCNDKKIWNAFVDAHGTIFHRWEWCDIFKNAYGYDSNYLIAREGKKVSGVLPLFVRNKKITSVPFADFAGAIGVEGVLYESAIRFKEKASRSSIEIFSQRDFSESPLNCEPAFCHFVLPIDRPYEDIRRDVIHQKTRNMINKADRMGVIGKVLSFDEYFDEYYKLYVQTMFKLERLPHPRIYFDQVYKALADHMLLFGVIHNKKLVAGIIAFRHNDSLFIWSNASNKKYLKLAVNNAVYDSVIRYAATHGITSIDFGSTIVGSPHYLFKKRFGGIEQPIFVMHDHSHYNRDRTRSLLHRMVVRCMRRMPSAVWQKIARSIYTHIA